MAELTPEVVAEITAQMQGDGVWVAPEFAAEHQVTAAQERELEAAVARTVTGETPVRVVLVDVPAQGTFNGRPEKLAGWINDDLDTGYVWVIPDARFEPRVQVTSTIEQPVGLYQVAELVQRDHPDDLVAQTLQAVELSQLSSSELAQMEASSRPAADPEPREGDGVAAAWVIGGLVLTGVVALVAARAGWRRWRASRTEFGLSATAVHHVTQAQERELRARAEQQTDALGIALSGDLDLSGPVGTAALDHYTAARLVLEDRPQSADLMGALVLARRGHAAVQRLASSAGDTAWQPPLPCWSNPGHDWAVPVRGTDRSEPALCAACRRSGPQRDVFRVAVGRSTLPWFEADLGVWTTTGFGVGTPDLPEQVRAAFA